jgi:hypothetical protein
VAVAVAVAVAGAVAVAVLMAVAVAVLMAVAVAADRIGITNVCTYNTAWHEPQCNYKWHHTIQRATH